MPAPSRPPISACELLDGMPSHQVMTFQTIAPISAPKITAASTTLAVDDARADRLRDVQAEEQEGDEVEERRPDHRAAAGGSTRVETMVAIELAASCRPFRKSNSERDGDEADQEGEAERGEGQRSGPAAQTCSITMPLDLVRDVLEAVDHLLQVVVDLLADR